MSTSNKKVSIWDLSSDERMRIVRNRFATSNYIVWDYARSESDGSFGLMERLGSPIDKGFIHGFVNDKSGAVISPKWGEINVYTDDYPLDEEFDTRTIFPYHIFSSRKKALEYQRRFNEYNDEYNRLSVDELYGRVLDIVKRYDDKYILSSGSRSHYEDGSYKAICKSPQCMTIFRIDGDRNIIIDRSSFFSSYVVPHVDLLDKCLEILWRGDFPNCEERHNAMLYWCLPSYL